MRSGTPSKSGGTREGPPESSQGQSDRSLVNRVGSSAVGLLRNTALQPAATQMTSILASSSSTSSKGESSSGHSDFTYHGASEATTANFQNCDRRDLAVPYPESFRTRQHQMADNTLSTQREFHAFGSNLGIDLIPEETRQQSLVENSLPQGIQVPSMLELKTAAQGINIAMQAGIDPHKASQIYIDRFPMYEKRGESFLQDYNSQASYRNTSNHALQDYQLQLMLLEQQHKKQLLQASQMKEGAIRSANIRWTSSDTDGQAVVALLSGVNLDLEETISSMSATQDPSYLEPLFDTRANAASIVGPTISEPPLPAVQSTSSSSKPSSLILEFKSLNQNPLETRTLQIPALISHTEKDTFSMYAVQSCEEDIRPWLDILSRYQDEVWGDILPLVQEARKEVKIANEGGKSPHNGTSALRRLAMVLGHVKETPWLEATSSPMTLNDHNLGKDHQ